MASVPGINPTLTPADANAQVNETSAGVPVNPAATDPFTDNSFHTTGQTLSHEAHARAKGLKVGGGEASASNDVNAEASLASGQVKGKLGNADVSAHAELGHVQFSEQASFKASAKDMSIDGSLKVHVDADLIKAGATISGDIPVQVNNETLHVKYALNLQGAVGINGDLNLAIHVGTDGARVTAQASGNVANASITGRLEIDDDQKREMAGAQLTLGVAAGVSAGAGGGVTRLTGKNPTGTEMLPGINAKAGGTWSSGGDPFKGTGGFTGKSSWWALSYNGKLALGPASGSWSAEVNAGTILRDMPKMVSPR